MTEQQQQIAEAMDSNQVLLLVAPGDLCEDAAIDAVKHFRRGEGRMWYT